MRLLLCATIPYVTKYFVSAPSLCDILIALKVSGDNVEIITVPVCLLDPIPREPEASAFVFKVNALSAEL